MTIDLKYLIPFVLPFIILIILRALCFIAGAAWSDPGLAFISSAAIGALAGILCVGSMQAIKVCWYVRIGGKK